MHNTNVDIPIKLLSNLAKPPTQGTQFSAGYDLYAAEEVAVPKLGRKLIKTNVSMAIPMNHYGLCCNSNEFVAIHNIPTDTVCFPDNS